MKQPIFEEFNDEEEVLDSVDEDKERFGPWMDDGDYLIYIETLKESKY